jgi:hypothetical protein
LEPVGLADMIELSMYVGIGFLLGVLVSLPFIPLIHHRAVRLTTRRLSAAVRISAAEIAAAKDLARAECAMSTRRLETKIEQLHTKYARHFAELARKDDEIHRHKVHIAALLIRLAALEKGLKVSGDEIPLVPKDTSSKTLRTVEDARSKFSETFLSRISAKTGNGLNS